MLFWQNSTTNQLGTFSYQSLSDFENDSPSSFTRTLTPRILSGQSDALGDLAR